MAEKQLLHGWWSRLKDLKDIHFEASASYSKYHHLTGIPLVILAALANAGIWAVIIDMKFMDENITKLILAVIGTFITVLSAVQAFLSFDKKSEMHKNAAMKYSSLSGDVDLLLHKDGGFKTEDLQAIKDKWGMITENSPLLPKRDKEHKLPAQHDKAENGTNNH